MLFKTYDSIMANSAVEGMPKHRLIARKSEDLDRKRELDASDLLALFGDMERFKMTLPGFVALNLKRLLPFVPDSTDITMLAMNVAQLQSHAGSTEIKCLHAFYR